MQLEQLESRVRRVLVLLDPLDLQVAAVEVAVVVQLDLPDHLDLLGHKAYRDSKVCKEFKEQQDLLDHREFRDFKVSHSRVPLE